MLLFRLNNFKFGGMSLLLSCTLSLVLKVEPNWKLEIALNGTTLMLTLGIAAARRRTGIRLVPGCRQHCSILPGFRTQHKALQLQLQQQLLVAGLRPCHSRRSIRQALSRLPWLNHST